jgi:hypothetical protein
MEKETNLPLQQLRPSYPVHCKHKGTRPFPYNGTFVRELFQIARSIPTHFPKVKENVDEFLAKT